MKFSALVLAGSLGVASAVAHGAPRPELVIVENAPPAVTGALGSAARELALAVIDLTPPVVTPPPLAPALTAGIEAYDALRFTDARDLLDRLVGELGVQGGGELDTAALSDAFLYRGLTSHQLAAPGDGWDDFVIAATLAPARTLDPARFPPRDVATFALARDAVAHAPLGEITVTARAACDVRIDGQRRRDATLPHGPHLVAIACPGSAPTGQRVALATPRLAVAEPVPDPIDDAAALIQARTSGAQAFVVVDIAGELVRLRVVAGDGRTLRTGTAHDAADVAAALRALVVDRPARATTRWHQHNWVWGLAGATLVAAVAVPLLLAADQQDTGSTIQLQGIPW